MQADSKESSLTLEALVESMVLGPLTDASGDEPNDPLKLIAMIKEGLSGQCLQQLAGRIPAEILSELLGRSESALSRLYSKRLNKLETDNIYDALLLWRELRLFFDDDRFLMGEWLSAPNPALSGLAPQSLMSTIEGRQLVRKCINMMRYGDLS